MDKYYASKGGPCEISREQIEDILLENGLANKYGTSSLLYAAGLRNVIDPLDFFFDCEIETAEQISRTGQIVDERVKMVTLLGAPYSFHYYITPESENKFVFFDFLLMNTGVDEYYSEKKFSLVGKYFAYPECCINEFSRHSMAGISPAQAFRNSAKNKLQIYHAYALHIPCSPFCNETSSLAKKYMETIRREFPRIAQNIEEEHRATYGL